MKNKIVNFIADKNLTVHKNKEILLRKIILKAHNFIHLPSKIEVEFLNLDNSVYAETFVNNKYNNRIRININLDLKSLVKVIIHELIHLNQIYSGKLSCKKSNLYIWEGTLYKVDPTISYRDYKNLPWELDVTEKENKLLEQIVN